MTPKRFILQYNEGIPEGSRLDIEKDEQFRKKAAWLSSPEGKAQTATVRKLSDFAEKGQCFIIHTYLSFNIRCADLHFAFRARLQGVSPRAGLGHGEPAHFNRHPRRVAAGAGARQPESHRGDAEADAGDYREDRAGAGECAGA